jgi:iron complex transport system substrate-binding protein
LKKLSGLLLILLGLFGPASPLPGAIILPQADGREMVLEGSAQRLVALSPNLVELVYAAGAGDALLAAVEFSDYPAEAMHLPRVGDAFRLDIEGIVAIRPDLVLAWDSGNPRPAVEQLRGLGIPVWSIEIREPGQIAETMIGIGRATGFETVANAAAGTLRERLARLTAEYADATPLDYFYQVDARPLFTINGQHLISRGLALCGGRNVFAGESALAFQVSQESVVVANPDALMAPSLPNGGDPLEQWKSWPGMKAVANGATFTLDADAISRATPRWLDSIETACTLLDELRH